MSDIAFNQIRYRIGLGFSWTTSVVRAMLVDSDAWVPNVDDDFVQTILTAGADEMAGGGYARVTLGARTVALDDTGNRGLWDCTSAISFGTVTGSDPYDFLVIYNFVTTDADSWLICAFDLGAQAATGSPITFMPHSEGILQWALT